MLDFAKVFLKYFAIFISFPIMYLLLAFILSYTPSTFFDSNLKNQQHTIYVSSNGVHLDLILEKNTIPDSLLQDLVKLDSYDFLAFGWGDKGFYINTPTWSDLTFNTAFKAMFWKSETLMHVTKYKRTQEDWIKIELSEEQFQNLLKYIQRSFHFSKGKKIVLEGKSYGSNDEFYEAIGNYTCFKTCNTWANSGLKAADVRTALWTPFDFGVLHFIKK